MLAMREEVLNRVVGGAAGNLGGPKFAVGQSVIVKPNPGMGIGTVAVQKYNEGWHYYIRINGGILYVPEQDLTPALQ